MEKICIIHNGRFSWQLFVDDLDIMFSGSRAATYFKEHYEKLGYKVVMSGDGKKDYKEMGYDREP